MDLKALFNDDDAVSPVIGVILMVAITVILAAVIASFVLGFDPAQNSAPQASFGWEYDDSTGGGSQGTLTVTHQSGSSIEAGNLVFKGDSSSFASFGSPGPDIQSADQRWTNAVGGSGSKITSGDSITIGVSNSYDITLVYQEPAKEQSTTLDSDTGPAA